jgi:hypothetical protein
VAALQGDPRQVYPETTADSLALLDDHRVNLSPQQNPGRQQLHALLRELMAGGAPTSLTPVSATSANVQAIRSLTALTSSWSYPQPDNDGLRNAWRRTSAADSAARPSSRASTSDRKEFTATGL